MNLICEPNRLESNQWNLEILRSRPWCDLKMIWIAHMLFYVITIFDSLYASEIALLRKEDPNSRELPKINTVEP